MSRDSAALLGPDEERAARAEREDRDARVLELAELLVAVPRDAVVAVAVVVEPDAPEADVVARRERGSRGVERRMRHRLTRGEPAGQARIVDHALVHPPLALLPLDPREQRVEQRVGAVHPLARDIDPAVVVEVDALERRPRVDLGLAPSEQGALEEHPAG